MESPQTFVPFNDFGKALNRSASPQRYPRPAKPTVSQPRRLAFGAAERAPTKTMDQPESPTVSTAPGRRPWDARSPARADELASEPRGARIEVRASGASCHDGRHPAAAMFNGEAFWATTGLFPQSALARLPSPTRVSALDLTCGPSVLQVTVSVGLRPSDVRTFGQRSTETFEDVATVTFDRGGAKRVALPNVLCRDVRIRIDKATEAFAIVQRVEVVGVPA
jgi:hypothetical protein